MLRITHSKSLCCNNREGLNAEFAALEEFADALSQDSGLWYTAQLPCNQVRNRYNDILANEPTRVRLASQPGGSIHGQAFFLICYKMIEGICTQTVHLV